jgi:phosphoglycolate phosphatase
VTDFVFDLDGTLVDSLPGIEASLRSAAAAVLPGRPVADLRPLIGPPVREVFRRALGEADADTLDRLVARFRAAYDGDGWSGYTPFPGVPDVIVRLNESGARCFLVTNKVAAPTARIVARLGLDDAFAAVVCPNSRTPPYPSKLDMLRHVVSHYAVDARRAVFVGDTDEDSRVAAAAGMCFAAVPHGYGRLAGGGERWTSLDSLWDLLELRRAASGGPTAAGA